MKTFIAIFSCWALAVLFVVGGTFGWVQDTEAGSGYKQAHSSAAAATEIVENLMASADAREWSTIVDDIFADNVLVDYSSFTGQPAATQTPQEIVDGWAGFLPGFDLTQHKLSNHQVSRNGGITSVSADVRAIHIIEESPGLGYWIVDGAYDFEIENGKVTLMRLNFERTLGNNDLPALAIERASAS